MAEITSGDNLTVMVMNGKEVNALYLILKKGITAIKTNPVPDFEGFEAISYASEVLESFDLN